MLKMLNSLKPFTLIHIKFGFFPDRDLIEWIVSSWGLKHSDYSHCSIPYYPRPFDNNWIWFEGQLITRSQWEETLDKIPF
jgi:hypothetical protein